MLPRLHLVTDDHVLSAPSYLEHARRIQHIHGGGLALHLRGHATGGAALFRLAHELASKGRSTAARLLVNDRVDVALTAGAHGVQLGRRSIPVPAARALLGAAPWIGYSAHDPAEAAAAAEAGADFVVVGAVYVTATHPAEPAAGLGLLRSVAARVTVPVLAIGGITPPRVAEVLAAGAWGVAVLGGVWRAADPESAVAEYHAALGAAA